MPTVTLTFTNTQSARIKSALEDRFGPMTNAEALTKYKEFVWRATKQEVRRFETERDEAIARDAVSDLGDVT